MNILTFDIEEWFHILDNESTKTEREWKNYEVRIHKNTDRILEFLNNHNQKATFFCLGWIAEKYPEVIKKIDAQGYEIGCHSYKHQLVYEQNQQTFNSDTEKAIKTIEDTVGKKVKSYRAPGFSITKNEIWALEQLIELGIEFDSSIFPAERGHGGFPEFHPAQICKIDINGHTLKEFPINATSILSKNFVFSGGGYFRLFPYPFIKYFSKKSPYIMTYFHPRDFDDKQPMIKDLSTIRKFKSYYNLTGALNKLGHWLQDFNFIDLNTANQTIDWDNINTVQL
ncbi:MAG: polysaccharide deacetylase family protein [Bacteroidales bacterium]|nr:polysaccharide deacetylase family protein [Bacteroidales bacterium]